MVKKTLQLDNITYFLIFTFTMKNILISAIVLTGIITLFGCEKQQQKKTAAASKGTEIKVAPDLKLSAVAQYLQNDGGWYITQLQFDVFSNPQAILLSANEPYGKVVWSVENGIYTGAESKASRAIDKDVFALMTSKDIAQGLMELYLATLNKIQISDSNEILNFNGKSYECVAKSGENLKLYRNKSTQTVDLVTAGKDPNGGTYLIFGYNFEKIIENGQQKGLYPSKVDIYLYKAAYDKKLIGQLKSSLK
jgi:hypothetical protein